MKHSTRRIRRVFITLSIIFTSFFAFCTNAYSADTIKIGHWSWPGYGFLYIAQEKNLAPDLNFEFTIIEDPVQLFSLLSTNQLDVVLSTIEFGPIAAAEKMPVKVAALTNLGYGSDHIILHPDIKTPKDLIGKQIAVLEGGLSQIYMAIWLEQNGISWDQVEMVNLIAGDAAAAMISGKIAAAELWDPFGGQVLAELKGSREVSNSKEEEWLKLGLIADALYVSDKLIQQKPELAVKVTEALFAGVEYWRANPTEANKIIATKTGFSIEDVQGILGGENNPEDGTMYMYSLKEAAQFCGVTDGNPPFGQTNGQMSDHWKLTNDWWIKFGLMTKNIPSSEGIDCSLLQRALNNS